MFHTSFFYCETFLVKKLIPLFKVDSILIFGNDNMHIVSLRYNTKEEG